MKRDYLYLLFIKNWKTTIGGIAAVFFTFMLWLGKIDTDDWRVAMGVIIGWIGFVGKDGDKIGVHNPNENLKS